LRGVIVDPVIARKLARDAMFREHRTAVLERLAAAGPDRRTRG
jgi:hypothetical protein